MANKELEDALNLLKSGDFQNNAELDQAHGICQAHEGQQVFDWLHGLIHRIEGDEANARYWYRRAGQEWRDNTFDAEWLAIKQSV